MFRVCLLLISLCYFDFDFPYSCGFVVFVGCVVTLFCCLFFMLFWFGLICLLCLLTFFCVALLPFVVCVLVGRFV